jgi:hypothetical protein
MLDQTAVYSENGPLENLQVVVLVTAFLIFLLPALHQKREDKLILLFFSFLCFAFILREVDIEDFNLPPVIVFTGSGIGRNLILLTGFITMVTYGFLHFSYYKKLALSFIKSCPGILMITAGLLLYIGDYFEHQESLHLHVFWEEMFELLGYMVISFAALITSKYKQID